MKRRPRRTAVLDTRECRPDLSLWDSSCRTDFEQAWADTFFPMGGRQAARSRPCCRRHVGTLHVGVPRGRAPLRGTDTRMGETQSRGASAPPWSSTSWRSLRKCCRRFPGRPSPQPPTRPRAGSAWEQAEGREARAPEGPGIRRREVEQAFHVGRGSGVQARGPNPSASRRPHPVGEDLGTHDPIAHELLAGPAPAQGLVVPHAQLEQALGIGSLRPLPAAIVYDAAQVVYGPVEKAWERTASICVSLSTSNMACGHTRVSTGRPSPRRRTHVQGVLLGRAHPLKPVERRQVLRRG